MTLDKLKELVFIAIDKCQSIIELNSNAVLSESDFERLLSNCISCIIGEDICSPMDEEFCVHTQLSHYIDGNKHLDIRPDIILLKKNQIINVLRNGSNQKGFEYKGPSIAIELKYFHNKDNFSKINRDFDKWLGNLNNNTYLFVVALFDVLPNSRANTFENRKAKVLQKYEEMKGNGNENYIFCRVLKKIKE